MSCESCARLVWFCCTWVSLGNQSARSAGREMMRLLLITVLKRPISGSVQPLAASTAAAVRRRLLQLHVCSHRWFCAWAHLQNFWRRHGLREQSGLKNALKLSHCHDNHGCSYVITWPQSWAAVTQFSTAGRVRPDQVTFHIPVWPSQNHQFTHHWYHCTGEPLVLSAAL